VPGDVVYDADVIATGPGSFIEIALENETFNVTTSSSLSLGVRGTEFEVTQSLFGEALVTVIDGEVAVGESNRV
jgi:hypothetical protein